VNVVTRTLALILIVGLISAPARAGSDGSSPYMERSERVADAAGLKVLDIHNPRGRVELAPSPDGRLHVTATKVVRMSDPAEARRYAAKVTVETSAANGRYAITVQYPRHLESRVDFWDLFSERGRQRMQLPRLEVRIEVMVPASMAASVSTSSGDIATTNLPNTQTLSSTSGDVEVGGAKGALSAESVSGDVTLRDVSGARVRTTSGDISVEGVAALDASSTSGDIEVDRARQALVLHTVSGDIVAADAPAGVRAHSTSGELVVHGACADVQMETLSGDVRTRLRAPLTRAQIGSTSGDVQVEVVSGVGATLSVKSTSGSIDCRVPAVILDHDRNSLEAKLGSGAAPVRLETTSGNVTITSGGK
jgi:hypothetical protein